MVGWRQRARPASPVPLQRLRDHRHRPPVLTTDNAGETVTMSSLIKVERVKLGEYEPLDESDYLNCTPGNLSYPRHDEVYGDDVDLHCGELPARSVEPPTASSPSPRPPTRSRTPTGKLTAPTQPPGQASYPRRSNQRGRSRRGRAPARAGGWKCCAYMSRSQQLRSTQPDPHPAPNSQPRHCSGPAPAQPRGQQCCWAPTTPPPVRRARTNLPSGAEIRWGGSMVVERLPA